MTRVFGLDLLRAVAILSVVYAHGHLLIADVVSQRVYNLPVLDGVTMFFVLSGFLIGRILLRTIARPDFDFAVLLEFWIRRWFRTVPNYFLVVAFLLIAAWWSGEAVPAADAALYFLFSQNLASPHPPFFPEAWSLTIEEWFYLGLPIPAYIAYRLGYADRRRTFLVFALLLIVACALFRFWRVQRYGYASVGDWDANLRKQVITRLDSLMYGVLAAYASLYWTTAWARFGSPALAAGLSLLAFDKYYFWFTSDMSYLLGFKVVVQPLGTMLLLPVLSRWHARPNPLVSAITFVSIVSYSMYLLNLTPVQSVIMPATRSWLGIACAGCATNAWVNYVLYWILTVGGAYLLYRHFEQPMTNLRDRWKIAKVVPAFQQSSRGA